MGLGRPVSRILLQGGYGLSGCPVMSENALPDREFREILVEVCRPEWVSGGYRPSLLPKRWAAWPMRGRFLILYHPGRPAVGRS
jgi:hypothetical protein